MIEIKIEHVQILHLERKFRQSGNQAPHAIRRALNHTGDKARTQVVRALVKQTGAKYGAVRKALSVRRANYSSLEYRIQATGQHIPLRDFGARQTRKGVSAAPWKKRRIFPQTFLVGSGGGHAFKRVGKERLPIKKLWGPAIPKEMVKDESAEAFFATVASELPRRIEHEIDAILAGHAPRG